jgi:uncharacterized RDD family membrane protein YckC
MQTIRVRTTQNVFIEYPLASIGDRILAYLVDLAFLTLYSIAVVVSLLALEIEDDGWYLWLFPLTLPWLFYSLFFEILMNGQTPGKKFLKVQVVKLDGTPPSIGSYLLRWLFAVVDLLLYGVVAIIVIAAGGKGQRLGDVVAGTSVIKLTPKENITAKEIFTSTEDQYVTTFPGALSLSDTDIELIQRALEVNRNQGNMQPVLILDKKIKEMLNIESDLPPVKFLYTIIKDHQVLSAGNKI